MSGEGLADGRAGRLTGIKLAALRRWQPVHARGGPLRARRLTLSIRAARRHRPGRTVFVGRQLSIAIFVQLLESLSSIGQLSCVDNAVAIGIESGHERGGRVARASTVFATLRSALMVGRRAIRRGWAAGVLSIGCDRANAAEGQGQEEGFGGMFHGIDHFV